MPHHFNPREIPQVPSHTVVTDGPARVTLTVTYPDAADTRSLPVITEPDLGAVVEDVDGDRYFHADKAEPSWMSSPEGLWVRWRDIRGPRLLLAEK